jgi:phosphate-selective porin OprO and OprP
VKQHALLLAAACGLILAQAAHAADPPTAEKLQEQVDALQKQLDELKQAQQADKITAQDQPRVVLDYNRATITSADGRSSIGFRALVQADAGYYGQDTERALSADFRRGSIGAAPNRETNAARDLSNGIYFRRARFGLEGIINRDFNYRFLLELGGSGTETPGRISDAWIAYAGLAPLTIQVGAFSPPANLDDGTSADETLFIERATPNELSRSLAGADARIGLGVRGSGTRWMGAATLTNRTIGDAEAFDAQTAVVGRGALLALADFVNGIYNVHIGASGSYVLHANDQGLDAGAARRGIRFRDRPELRVDSARLIDSGNIGADHAYAAGVDVAANYRNVYFQAENYWYGIDRVRSTSNPAGNPQFNGWYAQGSWIMTGETHRYSMANGAYLAPRPFRPFNAGGGTGAWELALRFSHTNLNEDEGAPGTAAIASSVRGGVQDIWTVGVNWYVTPNLRFTVNYLNVDVDRLNPAAVGNLTPFGAAPATPPTGVQIGQKFDAFALRSQFNF